MTVGVPDYWNYLYLRPAVDINGTSTPGDVGRHHLMILRQRNFEACYVATLNTYGAFSFVAFRINLLRKSWVSYGQRVEKV